MKNYTITVNGTTYQVTVEETDAAGTPAVSAPAPKKAEAFVQPKAANAPAGATGKVKGIAPMPGKIVSVKAKAGDAVKKGQVVVVLEAMKMENDIVAPEDGTVASIDVAEGAKVEAGAILFSLN